jgi:topoisomerase-4 subunit B
VKTRALYCASPKTPSWFPARMSTKQPSNYNEASIKILEGLEPVKLRPSQFTRTDSPLHIVQEVLDNAIDEAQAGHATVISIELLPNGFIAVADNGRGIPVGLHPEKKIPVLQAIFTVLYSGGKFDKSSGGAYSYAGGLHGVGVSVTNALSESLVAEVTRDGWLWRIEFGDGDVIAPLTKVERRDGTGTRVVMKPNPKYFDSADVPAEQLRELVKSKAVLLPGLRVVYTDARSESVESHISDVFEYTDGLPAYLAEVASGEPLVPMVTGSAYAAEGEEPFAAGEGAAWAFAWYERGEGGRSFVNMIPTPQHGTHVAGLRAATFNAVKAFIEHHSLMPKGLKLTADDVFKSVQFALSARMLEPAFDNQTKDRLNSRDGVRLVERMAQPSVESWLNHNPVHAKTVAELVIRQALARAKSSAKVEKRRTSSVVMLPGKLADCQSQDAAETELFLVEGDSAGGSAKMARNKDRQAILPMRGKGLNTWEKTKEEALANTEIHDISIAIGIPPHTLTDELDWSRLRYQVIAILADADVDGFHIQVLLLTLFFKHFPQLIDKGYVYVACPPLFRLDAEAAGKKRGPRKIYTMDEAELNKAQDRLKKEGYKNFKIGRFKGLGEMNAEELWDTTLNPDTRVLRQVVLGSDERTTAVAAFENLMSKGRAAWRYDWMARRGHEIKSF